MNVLQSCRADGAAGENMCTGPVAQEGCRGRSGMKDACWVIIVSRDCSLSHPSPSNVKFEERMWEEENKNLMTDCGRQETDGNAQAHPPDPCYSHW